MVFEVRVKSVVDNVTFLESSRLYQTFERSVTLRRRQSQTASSKRSAGSAMIGRLLIEGFVVHFFQISNILTI